MVGVKEEEVEVRASAVKALLTRRPTRAVSTTMAVGFFVVKEE